METFLSRSLPFWNRLSPDERTRLIDAARELPFRKGERLYEGGDCLGAIVVKQGALTAYLTGDDGREVTLYSISKGEFCAMTNACALSQITFDVTVEALSDGTVVLLPSYVFTPLVEQNVYVESFTYKAIAERFSEVVWAMQEILFRRMDARVAGWLFDRAADAESVSATHEQIARDLGSAREVVTRVLNRFAASGFVRLSRGRIDLLDRAALKIFAYDIKVSEEKAKP